MVFLREFNMSFLNFLVSKKILDKKSAVEGMIYHYQQRTSLLSFIHDKGILNDEDLFSLLDKSLSMRKSFQTILEESDVLDKAKYEEILVEYHRSSKTFSDWLTGSQKISNEELSKLIEEYEQKGTEQEETSEVSEAPINMAALESLGELGIASDEMMEKLKQSSETTEVDSNEELVADVNEEEGLSIDSSGQIKMFFTDSKKSELNDMIKKLATGYDKATLENLHTDIYKLLGVSKMCQETLMIKLLESWEKLITDLIEEKVDFTIHNFSMILKEIKGAINLLWEISEQLLKHGNVKGFLAEGNSKEKYLKSIETALSIHNKG